MKVSKKELFYNEYSDKWESKINKTETNKRLHVIYNILLKNINLSGKNFLDVGCGLGYFSEIACKKGAVVTGIDVGEELINKVHKKLPNGKFITASISKLPFKDRCFDIVLCTEVVEHVENQKKAISEIMRVVKKGGLIIVTTPNKNFQSLFILLSNIGIRPYHGNEKWFSLGELKHILSRYGLIIKEYYFNFIFPSKITDYFERYERLKSLMINQSYVLKKY